MEVREVSVDHYTFPYYETDPALINPLFPSLDRESYSFRGSPRLSRKRKSQKKIDDERIQQMIRDVDEYLPNDELDLKIYLKSESYSFRVQLIANSPQNFLRPFLNR